MKSMKHIFFALLAVLLVLSCAAAEVVVVDGADGPTAVFFAAQTNETGETAEQTQDRMGVIEIIGPVASAPADVPAESAAPSPEPTQTPRLYGLKIGIDPGHQAKANSDREPVAPNSSETKAKVASGTSGKSTGVAEYVTDLEIALKLRDVLVSEGATVYMTRETNEVDISNKERAEMMNELGVDLALRIHCDGAEDRTANGIGMFVRKTGEKQAESEAAAKALLDAMVEATGAKKRGVYLRDTYTMNNWSIVPCILVECGFMSNPEEDEKLNDPEYQDLLARGMAEGIARYFGR